MKHLEVVAAIMIEGNKVFCAQRKDAGEVALKWEFPGGKIEAGESHQDALRREILEELGIAISVEDLLCTVDHGYRTFSITLRAYRVSHLSGTLRLSQHLDSRWLAAHQLYSVDWAPADLPIVKELASMLT